ncbi:MAG: alpha-ketoacid dehydrogenase subunit beta [Candidatus Bathyarchaeia archaeon]
MPTINLVQAVNQALREEMRRNSNVIVLGEDVGRSGGVFRATEGLYDEFGASRVIDTPLAEDGIVGAAIGMALYGLKPVAEIQFADFIYPAFDQIVTEMAKVRYRSGGQFAAPVVVRTPYGGGVGGGPYHSQSPEAYFVHTAGLKVVVPSTPYDAKGLLKAAIRAEDPIIFLEPKKIYRTVKEEVPDGDYEVPLGKAQTRRSGGDVSILTYGAMVPIALEAAQKLAEENIDAAVVDLRTLQPLDLDAVLASVEKTGRAVIVHEAPRTCGFGAELAALISEKALLSLKAPIVRVTGYDTPFPSTLEDLYMPSAERIIRAVEKTVKF